MRIITGIYRGKKLLSLPGSSTRPTLDKVKETMFNVLQDCQDERVLDLYAGSGALGLEALSRGASQVVFVEFSIRAINVISQNIEHLKAQSNATIRRRKVQAFIRPEEGPFDLVILDPPYNKNLLNPTVKSLLESGILAPNARIMAEHSYKEAFLPELKPYITWQRAIGQVMLTILEPNPDGDQDTNTLETEDE